jgi:hypothetical protein
VGEGVEPQRNSLASGEASLISYQEITTKPAAALVLGIFIAFVPALNEPPPPPPVKFGDPLSMPAPPPL